MQYTYPGKQYTPILGIAYNPNIANQNQSVFDRKSSHSYSVTAGTRYTIDKHVSMECKLNIPELIAWCSGTNDINSKAYQSIFCISIGITEELEDKPVSRLYRLPERYIPCHMTHAFYCNPIQAINTPSLKPERTVGTYGSQRDLRLAGWFDSLVNTQSIIPNNDNTHNGQTFSKPVIELSKSSTAKSALSARDRGLLGLV